MDRVNTARLILVMSLMLAIMVEVLGFYAAHAPSGDFRVTMRLFWPGKAILDGDWKPPPLIKRVE